jgi:hypothetical protein
MGRGASSERKISDEHRARLRALLAREGQGAALRLLRTTIDLIKNALSGAVFSHRTVERLEAAIDQYTLRRGRESAEGEHPPPSSSA